MTVTSIGDLSSSLQLRRDTTRIKLDLVQYTQELSSGVASDLVDRFKGNFGPLSGIERGLARTESYFAVTAEHELVVSGQQTSLSNLRELGEVSTDLLTIRNVANPVLLKNAGTDTLSRFSSALSNLNVQLGGRSIFSGVATDSVAIADSDAILSAIEAEIISAGAVTAEDVATVVRDWFAPGGGFETVAYLGGAMMTQGPQLSDGEVAPAPVTADNAAIRDFLGGLALGSLLGRGSLSGDTTEQGKLAGLAGDWIYAADSGIVELQASIGSIEAQIDRALTEVKAEADGLEIARSNLIGADPYETAVNLETAETQLQTLYMITSRLSYLSLSEYL